MQSWYSIQLFNGTAGNKSKYFSRGIDKDQYVLLHEVKDRRQYNALVFPNTKGKIVWYIAYTPIK